MFWSPLYRVRTRDRLKMPHVPLLLPAYRRRPTHTRSCLVTQANEGELAVL